MRSSTLHEALSSLKSLQDFWRDIAEEVQEHEAAMSKKGSVCHIYLDEDADFVLEKEYVLHLLNCYVAGELPAIALDYIGNALMLSEKIEFADESVRELVPRFIDPEINGPFSRDKAETLIQSYL